MKTAIRTAFEQTTQATKSDETVKTVTLVASPLTKYHGMSRASMRALAAERAKEQGIEAPKVEE